MPELGYRLIEASASLREYEDVDGTHFWIETSNGPSDPAPTHVAFRANPAQEVIAFHNQAVSHGGKDNGAPGPRNYHPGYYGAFALDPDGENIEAVIHNHNQ